MKEAILKRPTEMRRFLIPASNSWELFLVSLVISTTILDRFITVIITNKDASNKIQYWAKFIISTTFYFLLYHKVT